MVGDQLWVMKKKIKWRRLETHALFSKENEGKIKRKSAPLIVNHFEEPF